MADNNEKTYEESFSDGGASVELATFIVGR